MNKAPKIPRVVRVEDCASMIRFLGAYRDLESQRIALGFAGDEKTAKTEAAKSYALQCTRPMIYADSAAGIIQAEVGDWPGSTGQRITIVMKCESPDELQKLQAMSGQRTLRDAFLAGLRPLLPGSKSETEAAVEYHTNPGASGPVNVFANLERWVHAVEPKSNIVCDAAVLQIDEVKPFVARFELTGRDGICGFDVRFEARAVVVERPKGHSVRFEFEVDVNDITDRPEDFRAVVDGFRWDEIDATLVYGSPPEPVMLVDYDSKKGLTVDRWSLAVPGEINRLRQLEQDAISLLSAESARLLTTARPSGS